MRLLRFSLLMCFATATVASDGVQYRDLVARDSTVARWDFDRGMTCILLHEEADSPTSLECAVVGSAGTDLGPRPPSFVDFGPDNNGLQLSGRDYLRFQDPGEDSVFDFDESDEITIEA